MLLLLESALLFLNCFMSFEMPLIFLGPGSLHLHEELSLSGMIIGKSKFHNFPDGEFAFEIEENIAHQPIVILQSTYPSCHDRLMELMVMLKSCQKYKPQSLSLFIPYLCYGRDKTTDSFIIDFIYFLKNLYNLHRVSILDFHKETAWSDDESSGIQHCSSTDLFAQDIKENMNLHNTLVISPDRGGYSRAQWLAQKLNVPFLGLNKNRGTKPLTFSDIPRGSVQGKTCLLVDDMIDSGETLIQASQHLLHHEASQVYAYVTHALCSRIDINLFPPPSIKKLTVTHSIPTPYIMAQIHRLSVASLVRDYINQPQ